MFVFRYLTKFQIFVYFLIGGLIFGYILYIQLILKRLPREIFVVFSNRLLLTYLNLFILSLGITLIYGRYLYKKHYKHGQSKETKFKAFVDHIKGYLYFFATHLSRSQDAFDRIFKHLVIEKIFGIDLFSWLNPLNKILDKYFRYLRKWLANIFVNFPRIVIVSCLLIDVFIYEYFRYFYLCGPLFLFILSYDYLLNTFEKVACDWLHSVGTYIQVIHPLTKEVMTPFDHVRDLLLEINNEKLKGNYTKFPREYGYTYINQKEFIQATKETDPIAHLEAVVDNFGEVLNVLDTIFYLKTEKDLQTEYITFCIYLIYSIIWGYICVRCGLIILI